MAPRTPAPTSRAGGRFGDLGIRAASALALVAAALASTWAGGTAFSLIWIAASVALNWEWQRLVGGDRQGMRHAAGAVGLVGLGLVPHLPIGTVTLIALLLAGGCANAWLAGGGRRLWAAGGFAYAGSFLACVDALRFSSPDGVRAIVWLFATVWTVDMFAYFGGRLVGGPKLWPRVSPSKTWSGTLTGVLTGGGVGTVVALYDLQSPAPTSFILLLTVAVAIMSQGGDAFESAVKRHFGVKDTSGLIPGHGGVMDRLDGFVAAAVFASLVGLLRNDPSLAAGLFHWP